MNQYNTGDLVKVSDCFYIKRNFKNTIYLHCKINNNSQMKHSFRFRKCLYNESFFAVYLSSEGFYDVLSHKIIYHKILYENIIYYVDADTVSIEKILGNK